MLKVKRTLSAFLTVFFLSCSYGAQCAYTAVAHKVNNVIEAEAVIVNNAMLQRSSENASEGAYLISSALAIIDSRDIVTPDMSFSLDIPAKGSYKLYTRVKITSASYDTTYYRIDSGAWQTKTFSFDNIFRWYEVVDFEFTKGIHKIEINHCDINLQYDAFFITNDSDKVPTETFGEQTVVEAEPKHRQEKSYTVVEPGITIEAEDATYYEPYASYTSKLASGLTALKSNVKYSATPAAGARGEIEFEFNVAETSVYNIWMRTLVSSGGQDSVFAAANNGSYSNKSLATSDEYKWNKFGSVSCTPEKPTVFKLVCRENGGYVDQILITNKSFTPTGRNGGLDNIPEATSIHAQYQKPPVNPPNEHPRVLFREKDVTKIRANLAAEQNAAARRKFESLIDKPVDGNLNGGFNKTIMAKIEAFAFDYAINKNEESGEIAVREVIQMLKTVDPTKGGDDPSRDAGFAVYIASEVYDWCYNKSTQEQKDTIIELCEALQGSCEMGWPPVKQYPVTSHGSEAQLLRCSLAFAIAVYDERPDIWDVVGGRFYEEYIIAKNFLNSGHYDLQGDGYGLYRHMWVSWSHMLITGMGAPDPYNTEDLYKTSYGMIYMRRPDGQYLRDGDTFYDGANSMWAFWQGRYHCLYLDSTIGKDSYLKDEFYRMVENGDAFYDGSPVLWLISNDVEIEPKSIYELPLSRYFGSPVGMMVARTGWEDGVDSPAVVAEMKIGEVQTNNHQHLDAGHFQIYYKGILASDSGVYQGLKNDSSVGGTAYSSKHHTQYATKAIAHNTMLVYDPGEGDPKSSARANILDGGQKAVNDAKEFKNYEELVEKGIVAEVEGHEIDPQNPHTPYYTYIKGDLTNAYTDKISDFKRSFMFLNMFDEEVPAVMVVFDKVTSSNANFKKTWLLHGLEEPKISGNKTIISSTYKSAVKPLGYNGKLTCDTLLPASDNLAIRKIGGEDGYSNVNGVDWTGYPSPVRTDEGNSWRVEVSPKKSATTDYFMNVLQVSDNDKNNYISTQLLDSNEFYGVRVNDRVVYFSKSGERVSNNFEIKGFGTDKRYTICDIKAGQWKVWADGNSAVYNVTEDGGVLALNLAATSIKAEYISEEQQKTEYVKIEIPSNEKLYIKLDTSYVYCEPYARLAEGATIMPNSVLEKWFKYTTNISGKNVTLSSGYTTIKLTEGSKEATVNEELITLGTAPSYIDGELMIPPRGIVEAFGGSVSWDRFSKIVIIKTLGANYALPAGYAKIKEITPDDGAVDGKNIAANAADYDGSTIWAALGTDRYIQLELEEEQIVSNVEIVFNPNSGRNALFEIMVSTDGKNFESVFSSSSDGSVEDGTWEKYSFEPVRAKYIRYYGRGSNVSNWNAIKEIRFK